MPPRVFLGLGANLGQRETTLADARRQLAARGFHEQAASRLYVTEPVGGPPQPWYLNQVLGGETALSPRRLLAECRAVERIHGRRRSVRNAPRTLDVDILIYGDAVRDAPALRLPHPRLPERRFVLVPLAEIAPALLHPQLGLSIEELLRRCPDHAKVEPYAAPGTPA